LGGIGVTGKAFDDRPQALEPPATVGEEIKLALHRPPITYHAA
jgi:hypothetical protein